MKLVQGLLELLSKSHALLSVSVVFNEHLIDLGHFDISTKFVELRVTLLDLAAQIPNRLLVAVDELLSLCVHKARVDGPIATWNFSGVLLAMPHSLCCHVEVRSSIVEGRVACLGKCRLVHVLEQLVLLDELVLEDQQFRVDLAVLVL